MNSYIKKFACFATTGAIVTLGALAGAQERGGLTVSGTTVDEKGKVMHGILVKAKKGPMTVTVLSKFDGRFTIPGLQPGTYEVRAVRRGLVADPQQVTIPDAKPVRFMLKPGPVDRFNLSTRDLQHVLPDSPYKQTLLQCEVCHSWSGLAARKQNYTVENWIAGIELMRARGYVGGAGGPSSGDYVVGKFTAADIPKVAEYLHANFGPGAKLPLEKLSAGPIDERSLNIRYVTYDIPTANAMPHTAFPDGQGHVWFTEYGAGKIGRVDVKTGTIEEFKAPSAVPPSPHGITIDRFGFVWYTEQTSGQIGRFDPKTNTFKQYRVPGPHNRTWKPREIVSPGDGPHTLIPDDQGKIWFTIAGSSNLRRLDPDTGDVKEYFIREEGHGGLYGVTRDPKNGRIWYAGIGFNEVGYVDPASGKVTRFSMLTPNAGPRRCHVDAQSVLWCDLYNVGKIARIDPATGKVSEWDLPGQRDGKPYPSGVDAKGRFWTQSATDDLLYMFDPKTEKFTTYQMPNNGNGLRDFYIDERGWMWAAVWGHNQVIGFTLDEK